MSKSSDDQRDTNAEAGGAAGAAERTVSYAGASVWKRLYYGETAVDFYGRRWRALVASAVLVVVTAASLLFQGLNPSLEFVGGLSWEVPAQNLTVGEARRVLDDAGLDGTQARVQQLSAQGQDRLKIQVEEQPETSWSLPSENLSADAARQALDRAGVEGDRATVVEGSGEEAGQITVTIEEAVEQQERRAVRRELASAGGVDNQDVSIQADQAFDEVQSALADAAGVTPNDVSISSVSASWGDNVTRQAVLALVVFLALVMVFIAIRFEPLMAAAALAALFHDILISVGVYSLLQLTVSPATVIAFLTILGYSLYDTIVVYDKIRENRARFASSDVAFGDITNVSMNQVLMRSLNTSLSSLLPVLTLLILGSWLLGASTLQEFSLALLIGMGTGVYSSIFIATPLLAMMHGGDGPEGHATGEELRYLVLGGSPRSRRRAARQRRADREPASAGGGTRGVAASRTRSRGGTAVGERAGEAVGTAEGSEDADADADAASGDEREEPIETTVASVLNHPPRPRKKKRH